MLKLVDHRWIFSTSGAPSRVVRRRHAAAHRPLHALQGVGDEIRALQSAADFEKRDLPSSGDLGGGDEKR